MEYDELRMSFEEPNCWPPTISWPPSRKLVENDELTWGSSAPYAERRAAPWRPRVDTLCKCVGLLRTASWTASSSVRIGPLACVCAAGGPGAHAADEAAARRKALSLMMFGSRSGWTKAAIRTGGPPNGFQATSTQVETLHLPRKVASLSVTEPRQAGGGSSRTATSPRA